MNVERIFVDGRVFSTPAHDRGMGRYVSHLIDLLINRDQQVTLLIFPDCKLSKNHKFLSECQLRFIDHHVDRVRADAQGRNAELHEFSSRLTKILSEENADIYIDATPFISPLRLDLPSCAVVSVCYDFIPLKHPDFYLSNEEVRNIYYNGLIRLSHADHVIAISDTAARDATRYLGIKRDRISVLKPDLDERYRSYVVDSDVFDIGQVFSIVGHHWSKNPQGALNIMSHIADNTSLKCRVNVPKPDQLEHITNTMEYSPKLALSADIAEDEKFSCQQQALAIGHFSREEGFGIPLLEALFLGKKVIALDVPINRELVQSIGDDANRIVFWVSPYDDSVDLRQLQIFLSSAVDTECFSKVRLDFENHWANSAEILCSACDAAQRANEKWSDNIEFQIFSSVPGEFCGVADYSMAYVRSATGNVVFYFSEGAPEQFLHLSNVRSFTYLDYDAVQTLFSNPKATLFNLAFSTSLMPGIDLLLDHGKVGDRVLVHERQYFEGLFTVLLAEDRSDELYSRYASDEGAAQKSNLSRMIAFHHSRNREAESFVIRSPIESKWLKNSPAELVSHLPTSVIKEMKKLEMARPSEVVNDLAELEHMMHFVPLGIDDRLHPSVSRLSRRLRLQRGILPQDIVIGHYGLIVRGLKKIDDIAKAIVNFSRDQNVPRIFLLLVGKVIHHELLEHVQQCFADHGISDRLIHENPVDEIDFDAEILIADAVTCFRTQTRGQLSHVFVRSLSLGTPVIVNDGSGYAYDERTLVRDDNLVDDLDVVLNRLCNTEERRLMRKRAREYYESHHYGRSSLTGILRISDDRSAV